jgi:PAS domain-containing protein
VGVQAKLQLTLWSVGLILILVTAWRSYEIARVAMEDAAYSKLIAIRETKKRAIEDLFDNLESHTRMLAAQPLTREVLTSLTQALARVSPDAVVGSDQLAAYYEGHHAKTAKRQGADVADLVPRDGVATLLQTAYLAGGNNPVAAELDEYKRIHEHIDPFFVTLLDLYGIYDVFLIDRSGRIVYTAAKEIDFGRSITDPTLSVAPLASAVNAAMDATDADHVAVSDFRAYAPSAFAPAGFLATRVADDGGLLGVVAIQIPIDRIDRIMTGGRSWRYEGLGESGETYIVGPNGKMRSNSRFAIEGLSEFLHDLDAAGIAREAIETIEANGTTILSLAVQSDATKAALNGISDTRLITDYRGVRVLSAFAPLDITGLDWAVLSEVDAEEAFDPAQMLLNRAFLRAFISLGVLTIVGVVIARSLARPLQRLIARTNETLGEAPGEVLPSEIQELDRAVTMLNKRFVESQTALEDAQRLTDSIPGAVVVIEEVGAMDATWNPEAKIAFANRAAGIMLGAKPSDLIDVPWSRFIDDEQDDKINVWFDSLLSRGVAEPRSITLRTRAGHAADALINASLAQRNDGQRFGVIILLVPTPETEERAPEPCDSDSGPDA